MTRTVDRLRTDADALLAAHSAGYPLVLPNVWDVASAKATEEAGFGFIATSSRAIAATFGGSDDDSTDPDVVFGVIARIARGVSRPVTVDLEGGYRLQPAVLVERLLSAGAVGCNLEDTDHHGPGTLVDPARQAEFLQTVRAAAEAAGVHVVINARIDTFLRGEGNEGERLEETARRAALYLNAGADCVYPIGLDDLDRIRTLTDQVDGPVNIRARPGGPSIQQLSAAGVRRISYGSGLYEVAHSYLRESLGRIAHDVAGTRGS